MFPELWTDLSVQVGFLRAPLASGRGALTGARDAVDAQRKCRG